MDRAWPGMASGAQGWAHHSPQAAQARGGRNVWDPNTLAQNLNDALGLGGAPGGGAPGWQDGGGGSVEFGSVKQLWSDPHMEQQAAAAAAAAAAHYGHMHPHPQGGMMNGMMDPAAMAAAAAAAGEWGVRPGEQPLWSDPLKQQVDDGSGYWKQQQQQQQAAAAAAAAAAGGGPAWGAAGPPRWPPQMPPPHRGMVRPGGGWAAPNGMMPGGGGGGGGGGGPKPPPMWGADAGAGRHMGGGAMGRGGPPRGAPSGAYPPRGIDMSVPPPIDMPQMGGMGRPPPQSHMWKPDGGMGGGGGGGGGGGSMNGMRGGGYGGGGGGGMPGGGGGGMPYMGHKPPQFEEEPMGKFSMQPTSQQPSEDLMWHDPNGELKKWQRDTGVSVWGDPDKAALRPVQNWMVGENEEEDLEAALARCPVPQKRSDPLTAATTAVAAPGDENTAGPSTSHSGHSHGGGGHSHHMHGGGMMGGYRYPIPIPPKRQIVVTGWGDLPDNDPNNPLKCDPSGISGGGDKWAETGSTGGGGNGGGGGGEPSWFLPSQAFQDAPPAGWPHGGAPGQGSNSNLQSVLGQTPAHTEAIAGQLRTAVEKGYLDMTVLTQTTLPPNVLAQMNNLLSKIPALEMAENRLTEFVESTRPDGELTVTDNSSPPRWLNEVQKVEFNRLMIEVTTARIELADLSKKMSAALNELRESGQFVGPVVSMADQGGAGHDNYQYSFLG